MNVSVLDLFWWDEEEKEFLPCDIFIEDYTFEFSGSKVNFKGNLPEDYKYCFFIREHESFYILEIWNEFSRKEITFMSQNQEKLNDIKVHFDYLNELKDNNREIFAELVKDKVTDITSNSDLTKLTVKFIEKTDQSVFKSINNFIVFERLLYVNLPIGEKVLDIFESGFDEFTEETDGFEETVDSDDLREYFSNEFTMYANMLIKYVEFQSQELVTYTIWELLKQVSSRLFADEFERSYSVYFNDINNISLLDCVKKYHQIETINPDSVASSIFFTYFLIKHNKFESQSFIVNNIGLIDLILGEQEQTNVDNFEDWLLEDEHKSIVSLTDINLMSGHEFEKLVAILFQKLGYSVEITKAVGDQGVDLIVEKDGRKYGVQTKCYSKPVSNKAIQEIVAGIKYYNLDRAIVVTNNTYTKSALNLAERNNVLLWDGAILEEKINDLKIEI
ncbi:restriction endonuclease [Halobacillus yeomjeoni]|uniref:Restriction endonuclease n=1 Tax=Halobacillus yeomjeoni TaxID=311194 RepID=A0A931HU85_9BACI|nr:restriction endonuclease [Halobacillus yeomjeoni]MBH0229536.1 restriction endonuclease [Halobacillus yeomjeoni]